MTKGEFIDNLMSQKVDSVKVKQIQGKYGAVFPKIIQQIISYATESVFFDDGTRILSFAEIEDADKDLHVDFVKRKLLPLADYGDNDFIVYHCNNDTYSMFNIIDECIFQNSSTLGDLLK